MHPLIPKRLMQPVRSRQRYCKSGCDFDRMNHILLIDEVRSLGSRNQLIRIPDQTDVPVTDRVKNLIDTSGFRRLGRISQLGLVSLVNVF